MKLKFNFNGFEFRGQVSSEKGKCVRNRLVRVYRKEDGNDHLIGASKTDSGAERLLKTKVAIRRQGLARGGIRPSGQNPYPWW